MRAPRRWLAALLLSAASAWPALAQPAGNAAAQPLDAVVAIVEEDVILASELNAAVERAVSALRASGRELPPLPQLQREIFDRLVVENLQLQMAERAGVRISDAELNEAMQRIASQNNLSLEQFSQALSQDGVSYAAAREQVRQELLLQRVQQAFVSQRIKISDQEIDNFLASPEGAQLLSPQFRVQHLLVALSAEQDPRRAEAVAQELAEALRAGEPLQNLQGARQGFTVSGGDLGWLRQDEMPSVIAKVAPGLDTGEVSSPVQSPSGFHVVHVTDVRGKGQVIQQTRASHILLKPSAIRGEEETRQLAMQLRQRALQGESFDELARRYSEDIGSSMEGGDLGWTSPGQLAKPFEVAMDSTTEGEISEPFQTQYGWHIVKVEGRRNQDVTDDLRRNLARNYLHQRKFQDELQAWLQKIRDEAYIDIKS